ncbi:MAG: DUF3862 domain-containing protein [Clostridium sp.]
MSKLISCKACGSEVAKGSKSCPSCGKDNRSFFGKHKIITGILVVFILAIIGGIAGGGDNSSAEKSTEVTDNNTEEPKKEEPKKEEPKKEENKVSYDNFIKIKMGSTYEDVVALLGEGVEQSSVEIAGIKTSMYLWNGKGISNMIITIQNGITSGKVQIGLKDMDSKVTLEMFNNVKEGMTYEEVKAILGEGQVVSESEIMDYTSIMYTWVNKGGANITGVFNGTTLTIKSQFNLK